MRSRVVRGARLFAHDMRTSVPLMVNFLIAVAAFILAFAVASGLHF